MKPKDEPVKGIHFQLFHHYHRPGVVVFTGEEKSSVAGRAIREQEGADEREGEKGKLDMDFI